MTKKKSSSAGRAEFRELIERKELARRRIPTEEEFARASAKMAAEDERLANIRERVLNCLQSRWPLHDILLFSGSATDYEALVIYELEIDIEICHSNGFEKSLMDSIKREIAAESEAETLPTVACSFHSYELVMKKCNGCYRKYFG